MVDLHTEYIDYAIDIILLFRQYNNSILYVNAEQQIEYFTDKTVASKIKNNYNITQRPYKDSVHND